MKTKQPNYCSQIRFKFDPSFLKSLTSTRCLCVQHIVLFPHLWKCQLCWRVCWLDKLLRGGFNLLHASWSQKHLTSHPKTWTIVGGVTPQNPLSTDHSYFEFIFVWCLSRSMPSSTCSTLCKECNNKPSTPSQLRTNSISWSSTNSWPGLPFSPSAVAAAHHCFLHREYFRVSVGGKKAQVWMIKWMTAEFHLAS